VISKSRVIEEAGDTGSHDGLPLDGNSLAILPRLLQPFMPLDGALTDECLEKSCLIVAAVRSYGLQ